MTDLKLSLDDMTFAQLVELGRATIPTVAPLWTDHNVHDPGMMLIELVAWTAETQIYSLGRLRRDERVAYGALLGVHGTGPTPASGLVWPEIPTPGATTSAPWGVGFVLAAGAPVRSDHDDTPTFSLEHPTLLTGADFVRLGATYGDGTSRDWTRINRQGSAEFYPFGLTRTGDALLSCEFSGPLTPAAATGTASAANGLLSIGVLVANPAASRGTAEADSGARLETTLRYLGRSYELPLRFDTTRGLKCSGVLLLDVSGLPVEVNGAFAVDIRSRGDFACAPRVMRIWPNVLPIIGRRGVQEDLTSWSIGEPGQSYVLQRPGVQFGGDAVEPRVQIAEGDGPFVTWVRVPDLSLCEPDACVYTIDWSTSTLHFGNGVNGAIPARGATLRVEYTTSSGAAGNVSKGLRWSVQGIAGVFGENPLPISGGGDATTLDELRRAARKHVFDERPLVTSADLQTAALALIDLQVARAVEVTQIQGECGRASLPGTRTLLAMIARPANEGSNAASEGSTWLAEVRRRLASRLPLGQQLQVVAPRYVKISIRASLIARPQADLNTVKHAAVSELRRRFALLASRPGEVPWPLERDVELIDVKAWLRKLPEVADIGEVVLMRDDVAVPDGRVRMRRRDLPLFIESSSLVTVERHTRQVRR
jgi:hypothetical protein